MHRTIAAICLGLAPVVAAATIYKVRMPDGSILFTDNPPPGAKVIDERAPIPPAPTAAPRVPSRPASATTTRPADRGAASAQGSTEGTPPAQTLEAAISEINEAERELAVARRRLEAGQEPLPGERTGLAKGGSRLTPEYEARVAGLEREVRAAEERVRRAHEARNALR